MNPEAHYETQRIDHLGIVAGIRQEIGLIEEINRHVGLSEQKVSVGQGVQAMVLNSLGYSRDQRPGLKQLVVQLITSQKSALPVRWKC